MARGVGLVLLMAICVASGATAQTLSPSAAQALSATCLGGVILQNPSIVSVASQCRSSTTATTTTCTAACQQLTALIPSTCQTELATSTTIGASLQSTFGTIFTICGSSAIAPAVAPAIAVTAAPAPIAAAGPVPAAVAPAVAAAPAPSVAVAPAPAVAIAPIPGVSGALPACLTQLAAADPTVITLGLACPIILSAGTATAIAPITTCPTTSCAQFAALIPLACQNTIVNDANVVAPANRAAAIAFLQVCGGSAIAPAPAIVAPAPSVAAAPAPAVGVLTPVPTRVPGLIGLAPSPPAAAAPRNAGAPGAHVASAGLMLLLAALTALFTA